MYAKHRQSTTPQFGYSSRRRPVDNPACRLAAKAIIILLVGVWLAGCVALPFSGSQGTGPAWDSFSGHVPVDEWNRSLEVNLPEPPRYIGSAYVVDALLMNRSSNDVSFGPGYGARALVYSGETGAWSEVDNSMNYQGEGEVLVPRLAPDSNWVAQVTIIPDISSSADGDILRIVVVGEVVSGGLTTDEKVGAYADIELSR